MEYDIYLLIDRLRAQPAMYIGWKRLSNLSSYISGYADGMEEVGFKYISKPDFKGFHDWVAQKFGFFESTSGWENMILAVELGLDPAGIRWEKYDVNISEEVQGRAVDRFFQLLDEYKKNE